MKKKWTVFALVILLIQYFSPLIAVAESINLASNTLSIDQFSVAEVAGSNSESVDLIIKGNVDASSNFQESATISGVSLHEQTGSVVSSNQTTVGTYVATTAGLQLSLLEGAKGEFQLQLTGQLLDKVTSPQDISLTYKGTQLIAPLTLTAPTKPIEEPQEVTEPSTSVVPETTPSKEIVTESNQTESTIDKVKNQAKEGPVDISTLLGDQKFFTGMTITDKDGGNLIDPPVQLGDEIKLNFEFAIPESVREQMKAGDYYDAKLPAEIKILSPINEELRSTPDGEPYGKLTIDVDGNIHIEFYEKVKEESNIKGTVYVGGTLAQGGMGGPGNNVIDFPFVEEEPGVPIIVKPENAKTIDKTGHPDKQVNPNQLFWDVDINGGLEKLTNAVVTENFPEGTKFESVKVFKLKIGFDGKVIPGELEEVTSGFTVDAAGNVSFDGVIDEAYRLTYTTTIDQDSKPGADGGTVPYLNSATLKSDELDEIGTTAEIKAKYNKTL